MRWATVCALLLATLAGAGQGLAAEGERATQEPAGAEPFAAASAIAVVSGAGDDVAVRVEGHDRARQRDSVGAPGVVAEVAEATAEGELADLEGRARARAEVREVSLLDGLVTADVVRRRAFAKQGETDYSGSVRGLRIGDELIGDVLEERRFALPGGAGTVTVNRRGRGLRVRLAEPVAGLPADLTITLAEVDADALDGVAPEPTPTATPVPTPTAEPTPTPDERRAARAARERRRLARGAFAFPVYGGARTADDYGAPRALTGRHEGNDIFAPFGAPVVAVADGTIEKVGTLAISGNRLWLRSDAGDTFFYAHLSAFAPAAVNGRRVARGTLLGFIGNTGDAEPTPPHLHFQAHPGGRRSVDPHAILTAWAGRPARPPRGWLARYGTDTQERPGALVVDRDLIAG